MNLVGLTEIEAKNLQKKYGKNISEITKPDFVVLFNILIKNLGDLLNIILLIAALISIYFKHFVDAIVVFVFLVINLLLSTFHEFKSYRELKKLKEEYKIKITVIRDGKRRKINIDDLVPGDLVIIGEGDLIPADGVLIKGFLKVNEATFTGESESIEKTVNSELFKGTFVVEGEGIMKVKKIGLNTRIGKINKELIEIKKDSTKIEKEISKIVFWLFEIAIIFITLVFAIGLIKGFSFNFLFLLAVSLLIATTPQGLPVLINSSLAITARKLAKEGILIKNLKSIEEMAFIDILFTDKTGTLTKNRMEISEVFPEKNREEIIKLAAIASFNEKDSIDRLFLKHKDIKEDEGIRFNSKNKYSAARIKDIVIYKGCVDKIIELFLLKDKRSKEEKEKIINYWLEKANHVAKKGKKTIMVGYENLKEKTFEIKGIIGLEDEIREGLEETIRKLMENGLKIIILTGDRKEVTEAILEKINLKGKIIDRKKLIKMSDEEIFNILDKVVAFTGLYPEDKLRIIKIANKKGSIAMLGDGVNDSLALKRANVSLVVGDSSDLAKGVADIVLLNNDLKKIAKILFEGRNFIRTLKKFVLFILPTNLMEMTIGGVGVLLKTILLTPLQILWINLVTTTTPAFLFLKDEKRALTKEEISHLINKQDKKFLISLTIIFLVFIGLLASKLNRNVMLFIIIIEFLHFFFIKYYFEEDRGVPLIIFVLSIVFAIQYLILLQFQDVFKVSTFSLEEIKIVAYYLVTLIILCFIFIEFIKFNEYRKKLKQKEAIF